MLFFFWLSYALVMIRTALILTGLMFALTLPAPASTGECQEGGEGLRCRAEQGDPEAQYNLAMDIITGAVPGETHLAGLVWLEKAAKQGHSDAAYVLRRMTLSTEPGESCSSDRGKSI